MASAALFPRATCSAGSSDVSCSVKSVTQTSRMAILICHQTFLIARYNNGPEVNQELLVMGTGGRRELFTKSY